MITQLRNFIQNLFMILETTHRHRHSVLHHRNTMSWRRLSYHILTLMQIYMIFFFFHNSMLLINPANIRRNIIICKILRNYLIIHEEFSIFQAQKKIASAEILPTNAIFSFL